MPSLTLLMQWIVLLAGSLGFSWLLTPWIATASPLVGAMVVAMCFGFSGAHTRVRPLFVAIAQAMTGVAIASTLDVKVLCATAGNAWVLLGVLLTVACAVLVGWILTRFSSLPGTTGAWGCLPGAAAVMGSLATQNGGDGILVSLMQYLRVVMVVATVPVLAHAMVANDSAALGVAQGPLISASHAGIGSVAAVAISVVGCWLGTRRPIATGAFLAPLVLASVWSAAIPIPLEVPKLLLLGCFMVIGWAIGLQFRRELALPMLRSLPEMLGGILAMLVMCGLSAWLISSLSSVTFITAYLATSPGGLDSIVAVALGSHADMNFVVAVQTLRLFTVLLAGPMLAKAITRSAAPACA
ncbi:AbrB family transcriptional regulator [Cupriavidus sp. SW-Y-13]|uniref:AbrB family transcriptional regulator n=1 Tax=Cupriavidus sp. SW-Y-13 TaxID=2653854 RepID=UPI001365B606|nr:AbrB family transcriptional regulator [Cupriavidus sp. SW-Y-13]MWL91301.1 AbrB family transcriptional regulator [Cupriavidus sp. SW-Y-13]